MKFLEIERHRDVFMAPLKGTSRTTLASFEYMNRLMSEGRSWTRRVMERLFLTKVRVRLFGVRIHHAYVGVGFMLSIFLQQLSSIYGFILLALGTFMVVHDLICHLIYRRLAERVRMFEEMLTHQREQLSNPSSK